MDSWDGGNHKAGLQITDAVWRNASAHLHATSATSGPSRKETLSVKLLPTEYCRCKWEGFKKDSQLVTTRLDRPLLHVTPPWSSGHSRNIPLDPSLCQPLQTLACDITMSLSGGMGVGLSGAAAWDVLACGCAAAPATTPPTAFA